MSYFNNNANNANNSGSMPSFGGVNGAVYRSLDMASMQRPQQAMRQTSASSHQMQQKQGPHSVYRSLDIASRPATLFKAPTTNMQKPQAHFIQQKQPQAELIKPIHAPFLPVDLQDYGLDPGAYAFSDFATSALLIAVSAAMLRANVDCEVNDTKCKCKGAAAGGVRFVVRVFQLTPAERAESGGLGDRVIVLQRRAADLPGDWQRVASAVLCELVRAKAATTDFDVEVAFDRAHKQQQSGPGPTSGPLLFPRSPPALKRSPSAALAQENSLKNLLNLVRSPYEDVRQQASEILMSLSRNVDTAQLLDRLEVVEALCAGMGEIAPNATAASGAEADAAWSCAAVATIANICARRIGSEKKKVAPTATAKIAEVPVLDVVVQLFLALKDTTCYLRYELRRETARALEQLTKDRSAAKQLMRDHPQLVAAMKHCASTKPQGDTFLASSAQSTLENLQQVCV